MTRQRWLAFGIIALAAAGIAIGVAVLARFPVARVFLYGWLPFCGLILLMQARGARPFRVSQVIAAILINANFVIFFQNREIVYSGFLKRIPQPILNCYFGPLTVFACPIGSFQQLIGLPDHVMPWLVLAFFALIGVIVGRMACGWTCAFGMWQDLLNKIPIGPQAGRKRWISLTALSGIAALIGVGIIVLTKVALWRVFLLGWLPFSILALIVVIRGRRDIPGRLWIGGFVASLLLGLLVWFQFEPSFGIVTGAIGMALLGLTGRRFAALAAALAALLLGLLGPGGFHIGPLSGIMLGITSAVTLAALVLLLDRVLKVSLPATFLKFGYLLILAGVVSYFTNSPWFCKLCPQGTLEAGIPQVLWNGLPQIRLREQVFWIYWVKVAILMSVFIAAIAVRRPFCRLICPIGAIYSPFNKISLLHLKVDHTCKTCRICAKVCPMDIEVHENANQLECIRCLECRSACNPNSVSVKI